MPERSVSYYDENFKNVGWRKPALIPMYIHIIAELKRLGIKTILDIGCGIGTLLSLCRDSGFVCSGFDFSSAAIEICRKHNKLNNVWIGDALDEENYADEYDAYLAIEVLEHITQDLEIIKNLRPNIPFIFSLPSWINPSHVRCFRSDAAIRQRYERIVDIKSIKKFHGPRRVVISSTIKEGVQ